MQIYDNFFQESQLIKIHEYLEKPTWKWHKSNKTDKTTFKNFEVTHIDYFREYLLEYINLKLCRPIMQSPYRLERVYFNGHDYKEDGTFHQDTDSEGKITAIKLSTGAIQMSHAFGGEGFTFITYMNKEYKDTWGGATEFQDPHELIVPEYNKSILFKGIRLHRGLAFTKHKVPRRITMVFKLYK